MNEGDSKKQSILIIEDDLILAKMYKKRLELSGDIKVEIATNGREGIEKAKSDFNLILLDILLPEIDGFDVLKILKSDTKTQNIPVIILTNLNSSQMFIQEGLSLGACDFLIKSQVSSEEVVEKIKKILAK